MEASEDEVGTPEARPQNQAGYSVTIADWDPEQGGPPTIGEMTQWIDKMMSERGNSAVVTVSGGPIPS